MSRCSSRARWSFAVVVQSLQHGQLIAPTRALLGPARTIAAESCIRRNQCQLQHVSCCRGLGVQHARQQPPMRLQPCFKYSPSRLGDSAWAPACIHV